MHNINNSVDVKPDVPLDLRTDGQMLDMRTDGQTLDPNVWERQLQQELLVIQKQQQMQKQLLINEFQKQHENLLRQHQAQLQEHLKLQQDLQVMRQRQEQLEKEKKLEQQNQEREQERTRRQQHVLLLRSKERARESENTNTSTNSAVASTEVKQKLQEFLLSKSTKEPSGSSLAHSSKLWITASHHTSLEQSSPPLRGISPSCRFPLPPLQDYSDDFPLRKTASEPNLKVRSRLKQKVAERRSSPLLRRKEGTVMTPFKKRALELMESSSSSSAPGSGPSSPNGAFSALGAENGPSSLPTTTRTERWPSQPKLLGSEGPASVLSLYTSPSLPNISLSEKCVEGGPVFGRHPHLLGPVPLPVAMEAKVSSSQQVLLQHLLQKELRQNILSTGPSGMSVHPVSPLVIKERSSASVRSKLQRHRPLNRTQSAPLPQNILTQLTIQQHLLQKQKHYQQHVHINKLLSESIEQLRQPRVCLYESEEEDGGEDRSPPAGEMQNCSLSSAVIKIKEEPIDSEDEIQSTQSYLHQVKGRLIIQATT